MCYYIFSLLRLVQWTFFVQVIIVFIFIWLLFIRQRQSTRAIASAAVVDVRAELQNSELSQIRDFLKKADEQEGRSYLREKIFRSIDYAIRRHDWYEDQRSRVLQTATAIASGFFGIVGISIRVGSNFSPQIAITLVGTALIALIGLGEII